MQTQSKPQIDADERRLSINAKAEQVNQAAFRVSSVLGYGFLEKVYENAPAYELRKAGFDVRQQQSINVHYENVLVGQYVADIIVDDTALLEIKAIKCFDEVHLAQCRNYLKATGMSICLLLNFGSSKVEIKRVVYNF